MSRMFILYLFSLTLRSLVFAAIAGVAMAATRKVHLRHAIGVLVLWFLYVMPLADALLPSTFIPSSVPEIVRPIQTFIVVSPPAVTHPPADATLASA